mmetsp:Transcript_19403/g.39937  ORF Transcript_19403/g.39937 Transcript_19403/m.39937 type:complete len:387 (+) Transcript_19403:1065-2225(+)
MFLVWMLRICKRPLVSGKPISTWTSSRPGRSRASSIMSFRFVIPISSMLLRESTPSIFDSSWLTTESETPVPSLTVPRCLQIASISSMMTMCSIELSPISSCSCSASAKSSRIFSSDPPTNLLRISGPLTIFGSRAFRAFPICRAIRVFPHPGGPYRSIPRTWWIPICWMMWAGHIREAKALRKIWLNSASRPPMPSFSKSKSPVNRLVAPPPPPPSATKSPVRARRAPPSEREKTIEVGASSWPIFDEGGLSSLVPGDSSSFFFFFDDDLPVLIVAMCLTVSSSFVPSKSRAIVLLGSMICSSRTVRTVLARRSVSISFGLAFGSAFFFLLSRSIPISRVASARFCPGTKGLSLTSVLRLRLRKRRCKPFSATSLLGTCGWGSTW